MDEDDVIEEQLLAELGTASASDVTDAQIEQLRKKIKAGDFPAFMLTDYKAGYYEYARGTISRKFVGYRRKVNGQKIRGLFPLLFEERERDADEVREWRELTGDDDSMQYSDKRMSDHITSAIRIHGSAKVAFGKATWEEVRDQAHAIVNTAVDTVEALEERAG